MESIWQLAVSIHSYAIVKDIRKGETRYLTINHIAPLMNHLPKLRLCLQKHAWCKKSCKRLSASAG